ncbi:hypothetical protein BH11MYX3_BH11MYX3_33570 [soil metagenome]
MLEFLLLGGVPAGIWAMERLRRRAVTRAQAEFLASLEDEVQVALHVANHEARSRNQSLHPLHLAFGMLQDEQVQELISKVGGDPTKLEDAINAALDTQAEQGTRDALESLGYVSAVARHLDRKATGSELWARIARNAAVKAAFESGGMPVHRLLFALVHGTEPPALQLPAPAAASVHVVLRNDDVTTVEFVLALLRDVFELDPTTANKVTMETHQQGRAIVGRFTPDVAASRIESARSRARDAGYPLWVGVEPC